MNPIGDAALRRLRAQLQTPALIAGRYEIGAELGRGGMGVVHRARDLVLGREVAVKLLAVDAPAERFADHLRREFALLAQLEHPGIVPIYDAGVLEDGRVFYVMRLVEGARLDDQMRRGPSRGELLRILLWIADAVAFAHARGVVHRDLKPANVMIGPYGEVLVLDWGIARLIEALEERGASGTPGYIAPEAAGGGGQATGQVDVFALGVILREMVEVRQDPVPRPLAAIIARAVAPDPAARYAAVPAFAADVRAWLDGEPVAAYREGPFERTWRFYRRHQVAILLVLSYILVRAWIFVRRGI